MLPEELAAVLPGQPQGAPLVVVGEALAVTGVAAQGVAQRVNEPARRGLRHDVRHLPFLVHSFLYH